MFAIDVVWSVASEGLTVFSVDEQTHLDVFTVSVASRVGENEKSL